MGVEIGAATTDGTGACGTTAACVSRLGGATAGPGGGNGGNGIAAGTAGTTTGAGSATCATCGTGFGATSNRRAPSSDNGANPTGKVMTRGPPRSTILELQGRSNAGEPENACVSDRGQPLSPQSDRDTVVPAPTTTLSRPASIQASCPSNRVAAAATETHDVRAFPHMTSNRCTIRERHRRSPCTAQNRCGFWRCSPYTS